MRIKLPYLKTYRSGDKVYYYVRRKGRPAVRLNGKPGTPEFMTAYQDALASEPVRQSRHGSGTFGALVNAYYGSAKFVNLKPNSKSTYRIVLEAIVAKHGHRPAATMPASIAVKIIEQIGATRPAMANLARAVLRRLMQYAIATGVRTDNPFAHVETYKTGTRHTWSDTELAAFEARWPLGTRERLAYALLLYTAQRGGDVARMRRQDIVKGAIQVTQEKTGAELTIPIHPNLHAALKAYPAKGMTLLGDQAGRPISRPALTHLMKTAAAAAGLPARCLPHGLRKSAMRRLAEAGGTVKELQSVSGHGTLKEVERYTKAADQRLLSKAAIRKLDK